MLMDILERGENSVKVIVGHYTSSREIWTNSSNFGIGKFVTEIKEIQRDETCDPFDFEAGLFYVKYESSILDPNRIEERLCERLGERDYDFRHNNCEYAITYILIGEQLSNNSSCADFYTVTVGEFKEVGMKVAFFMAFIGAIAGSLIRYSYVNVIVKVQFCMLIIMARMRRVLLQYGGIGFQSEKRNNSCKRCVRLSCQHTKIIGQSLQKANHTRYRINF